MLRTRLRAESSVSRTATSSEVASRSCSSTGHESTYKLCECEVNLDWTRRAKGRRAVRAFRGQSREKFSLAASSHGESTLFCIPEARILTSVQYHAHRREIRSSGASPLSPPRESVGRVQMRTAFGQPLRYVHGRRTPQLELLGLVLRLLRAMLDTPLRREQAVLERLLALVRLVAGPVPPALGFALRVALGLLGCRRRLVVRGPSRRLGRRRCVRNGRLGLVRLARRPR